MDIQAFLDDLLLKHDIPGASVAILADGDVRCYVAGVASMDTLSPVTQATLFPIGSITKVLTTTLLMQLVDDGKVTLDEPVQSLLPDLILSNQSATSEVTIKNLLTHTSGIAGDYLYDPGQGRDAVGRYVESLATVPILHPPGELFSYSNSAFILAGYIVEQLSGQSWHDSVRSQLLDPLRLESVVTLPEDCNQRSLASPHRRSRQNSEELIVGDMWSEFHAGAPAGFTPYSTPYDVIRFAELHLNGGRTSEGRSLVSGESVSTMQNYHVKSIRSGSFDTVGWGLGWALHMMGDEPAIGHNGGTSALLRVLPRRNFAAAVLTNASGGLRLGQELVSEILADRFGLRKPDPPLTRPVHSSDELRLFEGEYRHLDQRAAVLATDDYLILSTGSQSREDEKVMLRPIDHGTFVGEFKEIGMSKVSFLEPDIHARPTYLHLRLRAYRRVSQPEQVDQL